MNGRPIGADAAKLRWLIDLRWMIPGEAGGLETVAWGFLGELFAIAPVAEITLIVPDRLLKRFRAAVPPGVALLSRDGPHADLRSLARLVTAGRAFPALSTEAYDVAYSLNGRLHPDLRDIPSLVLAADLQHFALPDFFDAQERERRSAASRDMAQRARRIVTISEFSRAEIIDRLGAAPDRVSVSYLGIDADFLEPPDRSRVAQCLGRHGLGDEPYLFLPAQLWPHKNHVGVIRAMEQLRARSGACPLLVSSGGTETAYGPELEAIIAASPVRDRVRLLGRIPREDLVSLYAGALALVFCSRHEGFGLPVVEAMAAGCPVIASNVTSIPEVAGEAALLVGPDEPAAIADAIEAIRDDPGLRARLTSLGAAQAARFSWARHAREVIGLAFQVAGRTAPEIEAPLAARGPLSLPAAGGAAGWRETMYPIIRRRGIDRLRALSTRSSSDSPGRP